MFAGIFTHSIKIISIDKWCFWNDSMEITYVKHVSTNTSRTIYVSWNLFLTILTNFESTTCIYFIIMFSICWIPSLSNSLLFGHFSQIFDNEMWVCFFSLLLIQTVSTYPFLNFILYLLHNTNNWKYDFYWFIFSTVVSIHNFMEQIKSNIWNSTIVRIDDSIFTFTFNIYKLAQTTHPFRLNKTKYERKKNCNGNASKLYSVIKNRKIYRMSNYKFSSI